MLEHFVHLPTSRRRHTPTAVDLVLIRLIRSAVSRSWTLEASAAEVVAAAGGSIHLLQQARVRLLTRIPDHRSDIGDRALATLAVAISQTSGPADDEPDAP